MRTWSRACGQRPPIGVYLDAFYIARYPVTHAQYARFVQETGHRVPFRDVDWARPYNWDRKRKVPPPEKEDHPVRFVSWDDAHAYGDWAGLRLPTEAEWEKAATWDVKEGCKRVYPWGDRWDSQKCNSAERLAGRELRTLDERLEWCRSWDELELVQRQDITTPVGAYSPAGDSPYGCADLAGNVWEWVADWFGSYPAGRQVNPTGPDAGRLRVLRGSSWGNSSVYARCAYRVVGDPDYRIGSAGFRCARSP